MSSVAILGCSELVTLAGPARPRVGAELRELGVIRDGAMLIRDRRIVQVGRKVELDAEKDKVLETGVQVTRRVHLLNRLEVHMLFIIPREMGWKRSSARETSASRRKRTVIVGKNRLSCIRWK